MLTLHATDLWREVPRFHPGSQQIAVESVLFVKFYSIETQLNGMHPVRSYAGEGRYSYKSKCLSLFASSTAYDTYHAFPITSR